jgi:hypoxanthine phosphoribosyltransferase
MVPPGPLQRRAGQFNNLAGRESATLKILIADSQIRDGVAGLAEQIQACYADQPLTIVGVMTGSLVLLADLIRQLSMPLRVGVVQASSYRSGTQSAALRISADLMLDIRDRDVLLVDDIFDTGHTLAAMLERMRGMGPRSVRSAVLLVKQRRQAVPVRPDFVAFEIPDLFVVGYGLDYRDLYRNLPYLAALESDDLAADHS